MLARTGDKIVLALLQFFLVLTLISSYPTLLAKAVEHEESITNNVTVILQRKYLDGEVSEEWIIKQNSTVKKEYEFYLNKGWELVSIEPGLLVFKRNVQDMSPLYKMNGYFNPSINSLATFEEKRDKAKIIQPFFQIALEKMETRIYDEIETGIGIPVCKKTDFGPYQKLKNHFDE